MKDIALNNIPAEFHTIALQNGTIAKLHQATLSRVKEINPDEDTIIYKYKVLCPVCSHEALAMSLDGKMFHDIQLNCRHCGIFFRPVIKRN